MNYEKYLTESSFTSGYTDTGGLCGNDDKPPNTVLMGDVTVRSKSRQSINGLLNIHKPLKDYVWDEVEYAAAAADLENYHKSLIGVNKLVGRNVFLHAHKNYHMEVDPLQHRRYKQQGEGLTDEELHKEISDLIRSYMKTKPAQSHEDLGISPIKGFSSKILGIDLMIGENTCICAYPTNDTLTVGLVDISDDNGLVFETLSDDDNTYFIMTEVTILGGGEIESDDDYPVGNIVWGEKMVPEYIKSIQGLMKRYKSDPNFTWTEFERCQGMDDKKNYHSSLLGLEKLINREDFTLDKYIGRSKDDAAIMKKRFKINAKEPLGKEPTTSVKTDIKKDGELTTKVKSVGKEPEVKPNQQGKEYADIDATSIDKNISKHVMKNIKENRLIGVINKYIGEPS